MFRVTFPPSGPRLYVFGRRVHHFTVGLVMVAAGALLMAHDHHDSGVWWTDFRTKL